MRFRRTAATALTALTLAGVAGPASAHSAPHSAKSVSSVKGFKLKSLRSPDAKTLTATLSMPAGYHFTVAGKKLELVGPGRRTVGSLGTAIKLKNGKTAHVSYRAKGATVTVRATRSFRDLGVTARSVAAESYSQCANEKIKDYVVSGGIGGCIAGAETGCAAGATAGAFGGLVSGAVLSLSDC
ncbi:hypothetical protein SAMN05428945_2587 [Streptomyces sp. 2224.1]|nr:hypothetical protein BX261_2729 [Streptomyces sp. 2321.6]SDR46939.1 hypothetical protein SAMN05216511_4473 [Streptomyces sp. KS_16]SEC31943.1 hypothetical protein SAMN05428945_2587 [Streptomyces sp. 2224.1]SEC72911.1 hypothetical protein SAMN05428940_2733 [Streptomyces sp. 2133.1]SEE91748.1 hypothetical protein SAMN05428954_4511 [Streptomyces sp. 2112.3]SNC68893.1 hypothetical protein SAMN06272741_2726 [Streptomyces sp. 2114.4]